MDNNSYISYLETLKEKFRAALRDEREANQMLEHARRRKAIYGQTLVEEGIDLAELSSRMNGFKGHLDTMKVGGQTYKFTTLTLPAMLEATVGPVPEKPVSQNGLEPLSDTHALYLIMRKHGNVGFTFAELKGFSDAEGYGLSLDSIKNTYWKQLRQGRMERTNGGKIRLTSDGEKFNKFRPPALTGDKSE